MSTFQELASLQHLAQLCPDCNVKMFVIDKTHQQCWKCLEHYTVEYRGRA